MTGLGRVVELKGSPQAPCRRRLMRYVSRETIAGLMMRDLMGMLTKRRPSLNSETVSLVLAISELAISVVMSRSSPLLEAQYQFLVPPSCHNT